MPQKATRRQRLNLFWAKVDKTSEAPCWVWTAAKINTGYGIFGLGKPLKTLASRVSWAIANRQVPPKGMFVCHHCDNRACVRPAHLFIGTAKDNTQDALKKGRIPTGDRSFPARHPEMMPRGEDNPWAKLTAAKVRRILKAKGTQQEIADKFGVSRRCIGLIRNNITWRHIPRN